MQRSIGTLPIPSAVRSKLISSGFQIVGDLNYTNPDDLNTKISLEDATAVFSLIKPSNPTITLLDLLKEERKYKPIVTFSQKIDEILGGGIPVSKITEICGAPGCGKTQLCLQLCVDVQIPKELGGLGQEVLFVDTEGTFTVERVTEIANASVKHCNLVAQRENKLGSLNAARNFKVESVLERIHYFRCFGYVELIAIVNLLAEFIQSHPLIRLVVIDGIANPFRVHFDGKLNVRTRILSELGQKLSRIAGEHQVAIVITNQMTTKFEPDGRSSLAPSLGQTWGHAVTLRLTLSLQGTNRAATLNKSPFKQESTTQFQITTAGIRDVTTERPQIVTKNINKRENDEKNGNFHKKSKMAS